MRHQSVQKGVTLGQSGQIIVTGSCSSQNLVILAESEHSGSLLDIENPAQGNS